MDDLILLIAPHVFHFPFPLKHILFQQNSVSRHKLFSACCPIIILLLLVSLEVGLDVCFSLGLFEAASNLVNILGDMVGVLEGTPGWKIKINWEPQTPPKH